MSGDGAWTRGDQKPLPHSVVVTGQEYCCEGSSYDCSLDEGINFFIPSPYLAEGLGLQWNGVEGEFTDSGGQVVCRDPSVRSDGPAALLVRAGALRRFLDHTGLEVVWTVLGEKRVVTPGEPFRRWAEISGAMRIQDRKKLVRQRTYRLRRS